MSRKSVDVSGISIELEDVMHVDASTAPLGANANEPPRAEDVRTVFRRVHERAEQPLAASSAADVLSERAPARYPRSETRIVEYVAALRHPSRVLSRDVAELLVPVQSTQAVTRSGAVDLAHHAPFRRMERVTRSRCRCHYGVRRCGSACQNCQRRRKREPRLARRKRARITHLRESPSSLWSRDRSACPDPAAAGACPDPAAVGAADM